MQIIEGFRAIGLQLAQPPNTASDALALAERAEAAGFDLVGVGDVGVDCFSMLGAVAARTTKVEIVADVAGWSRSPVTTALAASTLGELSGGRFRLGLGTQPKEWSEGWHGVSYDRPAERMRDYVAAIRAAYAAAPGDVVNHHGPRYRIESFTRFTPVDAGPLRLYLGVTRPGMTRLAGEVADGIICNTIHSVPWLADCLWPQLEAGLAASGRTRESLDVGLALSCSVAGDEEEAIERARPGLAFFFRAPYFQDLLRFHGFDDELERGTAAFARGDLAGCTAAITDRVLAQVLVAGTPAQVHGRLARYRGLVDWICLTPVIAPTPAEMQAGALRIVDAFS
ncbi:MAG: LLM class flavin-dependent oxidoreductase [Gammaproteobacteria bacterium]|nr:LLM class flavin-dependent oxidoreductase [Gammaproteobacteria bacterium]